MSELLDATDRVIAELEAMSDEELIQALEACDDTISYGLFGPTE